MTTINSARMRREEVDYFRERMVGHLVGMVLLYLFVWYHSYQYDQRELQQWRSEHYVRDQKDRLERTELDLLQRKENLRHQKGSVDYGLWKENLKAAQENQKTAKRNFHESLQTILNKNPSLQSKEYRQAIQGMLDSDLFKEAPEEEEEEEELEAQLPLVERIMVEVVIKELEGVLTKQGYETSHLKDLGLLERLEALTKLLTKAMKGELQKLEEAEKLRADWLAVYARLKRFRDDSLFKLVEMELKVAAAEKEGADEAHQKKLGEEIKSWVERSENEISMARAELEQIEAKMDAMKKKDTTQ